MCFLLEDLDKYQTRGHTLSIRIWDVRIYAPQYQLACKGIQNHRVYRKESWLTTESAKPSRTAVKASI